MKPKYFLFLLLTLTIIHQTSSIATVRYVSKTGTSTPPYASWQTAADSIQKCINICSFGDTVYVANGVYKEQVVMIDGLSLIGAGTDSCIIDTRGLVLNNYRSVDVKSNCLIKGFYVLSTNDLNYGYCIYGRGQNSLITENKTESGNAGIILTGETQFLVYNNLCINNRRGVTVYESPTSIVRKNIVSSIPSGTGIYIEAFNSNYAPIIDSNYIEANQNVFYGIQKGFGSSPIIRNNLIKKKTGSYSIYLSTSDSTIVENNTIITSSNASTLIGNAGVTKLQFNNNYILGGNYDKLLSTGPINIIKNNVVHKSNGAISPFSTQNLIYKYNDIWNSDVTYSGFSPDSTNISVDPMVVNDDTTQGELDFHLQKYSPLIDAGDPTMIDKDSSRIDIGLYGGLYGEAYNYFDLAPRSPMNLIAEVDTNQILLKWNRNTEADTAYYNIYRDTVSGFTIDSTKLISSQTDTFFVHLQPYNSSKYVYKITCVDNQGNESKPSQELVVNITSVSADDYPMIISDYILYQNYPNPFNPTTKIAYRLKESGYVKLYVYDIKGELISILVNQQQLAGFYEVEFFSSSIQHTQSSIKDIASGVYIYQLLVKSENNIPVFTDIKKMIYIK